ncbi:hypothetical protein N7462_004618 [Penicillium macrosclerotiorum]|uniref:uncharacterized protein n=1 Tax=Penicillium macrosclerotiorum TaxID=303699 RepID=UPI002548D04D|nr:uncharacterized protein N7462_004618 [Penicillium macrosclerotiorum]KAJ5690226.1 hypothetical protein N7462_004618 [Penicillium macrosclerotiorum]
MPTQRAGTWLVTGCFLQTGPLRHRDVQRANPPRFPLPPHSSVFISTLEDRQPSERSIPYSVQGELNDRINGPESLGEIWPLIFRLRVYNLAGAAPTAHVLSDREVICGQWAFTKSPR